MPASLESRQGQLEQQLEQQHVQEIVQAVFVVVVVVVVAVSLGNTASEVDETADAVWGDVEVVMA